MEHHPVSLAISMLTCIADSLCELVASVGNLSHLLEEWEKRVSRAGWASGVYGPKNMAIRPKPMPCAATPYQAFF
jgi:hypothetical protein